MAEGWRWEVNVGEANDVNTVLKFFLGVADIGEPIPVEVCNRAERLVRRAHDRLLAGLGPLDVVTAWPMEAIDTEDRQRAREVIVAELRRRKALAPPSGPTGRSIPKGARGGKR